MNSGPGAGVDPRVPQKVTRTESVSRGVLAAMAHRELLEMRALDQFRLEQGNPARRHRDVARGANPAFEVRPLSQQRARSVLSETLAAALDPDDPVEDQHDLRAGLTFLEENRARRESFDPSLAAPLHQLRGQRR